jgi:hypothetical protein
MMIYKMKRNRLVGSLIIGFLLVGTGMVEKLFTTLTPVLLRALPPKPGLVHLNLQQVSFTA